MNVILKFTFLFLPIIGLGQQTICVYNNWELLGNDTVNLTINNLKQGLWINYETLFESIECYTPKQCTHQKIIKFIHSKGEYINGKKVGEWNHYYETGELKRKVVYSENEEKIGTSFEYFKNGRVKSEQNWINNMIESQKVFYENGLKKYESKFQNQKLVSFKIFYESGEIKYKGLNVNNWEIGEIILYEKSGEKKLAKPKKLGVLLSDEGLIEYL